MEADRQPSDAGRQQRAYMSYDEGLATVNWAHGELETYSFEACGGAHEDLGQSIESKKHDNLVLSEMLAIIGLIESGEFSRLRMSQASTLDVAESLSVVSAIRSRLGDILLKARHVSSTQLEQALDLQRTQGGLLGEILVNLGWLDRSDLHEALVSQARLRDGGL